MITVRQATYDDLGWIAGQLQTFNSALNTKHSYIPRTAALLRDELATMIDSHVLLVAWDDGVRVGTIGGMGNPHPYNPDLKTLSLAFWWVAEGHRGSGAGYSLLRAFLKLGESCDMVSVGFMDRGFVNQDTMDKMGFSFREIYYIKEN